MAKFEDGSFKGAIGNVVFYTMNGKTYAKIKSHKRKKKRNEPESPQVIKFSKTSIYGTPIINCLKPYLLFPFKRNTYNHFRKWLGDESKAHEHNPQWEVSTTDTPLYNINREADLRDVLQILPQVAAANGKVTVNFPSFIPVNKIKAPANITEVNIKVIAVTAPFSEDQKNCFINTANYTVTLNRDVVAAKDIVLEIGGSMGDMLFVIVGIECVPAKLYGDHYLQDTKWLPAAIVAAGKL